jgi:phage shock protein A
MKNGMPKKSFWNRPEGVTGAIVLIGLTAGLAYSALTFTQLIFAGLKEPVTLGIIVTMLAGISYILIDSKLRNLIWFGFKGMTRWLTSWFIHVDPIGVLKSYLDDLRKNHRNMNKQIGALRGQMRRLKRTIDENKNEISKSTELAQRAKINNHQSQLALELRKIGRYKQSNQKLETLYQKMEILYRVLEKMYNNSEILLEDLKDQIKIKEAEKRVIHASHSAMQSAMNIISGNKDKRYLFDEAMEALAEDVATKVGEMERFMDISSNFMNTIDLQQGVLEDEGLKLLREWEQKSDSLLLGSDNFTEELLNLTENPREKILQKEKEKHQDKDNHYNDFF